VRGIGLSECFFEDRDEHPVGRRSRPAVPRRRLDGDLLFLLAFIDCELFRKRRCALRVVVEPPRAFPEQFRTAL
jgi:hypothetical protein